MTVSTGKCGIVCWTARKSNCRCACNGLNHALLTLQGGEQPARYCVRRGKIFRLAGLYELWNEADRRAWTLSYEYNQRWGLPLRTTSAFQRSPTKAMLQWPEVVRFIAETQPLHGPRLVWVRASVIHSY